RSSAGGRRWRHEDAVGSGLAKRTADSQLVGRPLASELPSSKWGSGHTPAATNDLEEQGTCMQRSRALPCLAVIIGVAVAACGGSDKKPPADQNSAASVSVDQRSILATIDALQTASRRGDGHTICDELLTPQLVR